MLQACGMCYWNCNTTCCVDVVIIFRIKSVISIQSITECWIDVNEHFVLRSDWCTLHLSLSQAMPPSESGQSEAVLQDRCNAVDLPSTYKVKVCKFCRASSWTKSPLPPGIFTHWDPLLPWSQGRRDKPLGFMCKICVSVLGNQSVRQNDLFCFLVANNEITQWLEAKRKTYCFLRCLYLYDTMYVFNITSYVPVINIQCRPPAYGCQKFVF